MKTLYILLFSLSIIFINPWGNSRGEIWTQPKVFIILLIFSLNLFLLCKQKQTLTLSPQWKISRTLWVIFLGIGTLSTLESPFPLRSLFGQDQMGDGLLYWLLIAGFTLTNTLLLKIHPELLTGQILLSQNRPLAAIALTYLLFTFTWFDCAQYTHIARWCFSVTECAGKHN